MSAPENPPAFPQRQFDSFGHADEDEHSARGMTLRDWFAGQAIGSALLYAISDEKSPFRRDFLPEEWAAKIAFATADAMLAVRALGTTPKGEGA